MGAAQGVNRRPCEKGDDNPVPRDRNDNGRYRGKRGDTHVGTIEQAYNVDFGGRSDKHLSTLRRELGASSIQDLVRIARDGK